MVLSSSVKLQGFDKFRRSLKKVESKYEKRFADALKVMGLFVQRESQQIVPIDTANLKRSAFTRSSGRGFKVEVRVGYTAEYAIYVHENLEANHPVGENKFLEKILRVKRSEMMAVFFAAMKA